VVWSFLYVALCRLLQLVVLLSRSERSTRADPRFGFTREKVSTCPGRCRVPYPRTVSLSRVGPSRGLKAQDELNHPAP
jgi:hypothetical protein